MNHQGKDPKQVEFSETIVLWFGLMSAIIFVVALIHDLIKQ